MKYVVVKIRCRHEYARSASPWSLLSQETAKAVDQGRLSEVDATNLLSEEGWEPFSVVAITNDDSTDKEVWLRKKVK